MSTYTKFEHDVWMHRKHTCPECQGAAKLQSSRTSQDYVVVCRECDFNRNGTTYPDAVDAFAAWAQLPRTRIQHGVSLEAAAEMCARLMGWLDFPTDGEGDRCWYKDPARAPFGLYVDKDDWTPLTSVGEAMDLALRYQLEVKVTDRFVYVTLPATKFGAKKTQMCTWSQELHGAAEQHAKRGALCRAIVLACADIYLKRGPDSLLDEPVATQEHDA